MPCRICIAGPGLSGASGRHEGEGIAHFTGRVAPAGCIAEAELPRLVLPPALDVATLQARAGVVKTRADRRHQRARAEVDQGQGVALAAVIFGISQAELPAVVFAPAFD